MKNMENYRLSDTHSSSVIQCIASYWVGVFPSVAGREPVGRARSPQESLKMQIRGWHGYTVVQRDNLEMKDTGYISCKQRP